MSWVHECVCDVNAAIFSALLFFIGNNYIFIQMQSISVHVIYDNVSHCRSSTTAKLLGADQCQGRW